MKYFDFEDWSGANMHVDGDGKLIDWYVDGARDEGSVLIEMPVSAVPNLIAWLYGQLDADRQAKVLDGLTPPAPTGIRGVIDRALGEIARRLVQVNAGKVLA